MTWQHFRKYSGSIGTWNTIWLGLNESYIQLRKHLRMKTQRATLKMRLPGYRHELYLRAGGSDRSTLYQAFIQREYAVLSHLVTPQLIIDCGANVGYSSVYFLNRFPGVRVIAVEPDPSNVDMCRRNLAPYGDRATVVHSAVWSHPTKLVVSKGAGDGLEWGTQVREPRMGELPDVEALDIPALMDMSDVQVVDLLKIDIESSEAEVFRENAAQWLKCVRTIAIELHGDECKRIFFRALADFDFEVCYEGELTICKNIVPKCN
jgi:FkbM family methyltransferase